MSHSSSKLRHGSLSGFRKGGDANRSLSSERTKRDIGSADDVYGEVAPELTDGVLLSGRYLVLRRLGRGGFSDVYLAHDRELDRAVAVKRLLLTNVDPHFIKAEAKTLASLDHPAIVRIYDICNEPMHGYLVIMQYVPGPMLREVLTKPLPINRAVEIAIRVSGGLIHAHSRGVVHRDIKPTNILMSNEGEPLIADFGLAFTPLAQCEPEGGTPRYMSPEQIRNETKRIGPSSDIFSTGILLYEMLAGRVPFNGPTAEEISRATLEQLPQPINEVNVDVPVELDRIVRRALRKNVKDRYNSMEAFQAELIQWLNHSNTSDDLSTVRTAEWERSKSLDSTFASSTFNSLGQFTHRGLQPFESDDAKFFLSLVPGARAPSGLPESVQYWKDWMESYDGSEYGRIAIMYGPSGSGKTSMLRAGIVPYLTPDLLSISIECRKGEKISQFSMQIQQQLGQQSGQHQSSEPVDLAVLLLKLRDDPAARNEHRKVVLLFDQFDNWAGSATSSRLAELAAALRHCDGERLQALLVVRDDFWTSATEFMRLVECGVEQWKNARSIDLLDRHHARRLLEAAGRGFGSLPPSPEPLSVDQAAFIKQAVSEMSTKGRVLPIQLAMFAKIAKLQSWQPETLTQAGGVQGTYVEYFQDLFESPTSPPAYRRVSSAVVEVLHCLLPNADQKAHSHQVEFRELEALLVNKKLETQLHRALSILVEDLRIVVRVSHPGSVSATEYAIQCNDRFHLVHDFLTIPIANWVDQVRKSSWRGRALARLEELSAMWIRKQHHRFLPTLPEFIAMQIATPPKTRSPEHRRFLRSAGRKHFLRALIALAVITPVTLIAVSSARQRQHSIEQHQKHIVEKVENAIRNKVHYFKELMSDARKDLDYHPQLVSEAARPWEDSSVEIHRIRAQLLLAAIQKTGFEKLLDDLDKIEPQLCKEFVQTAHHFENAKRLLNEVINNSPEPGMLGTKEIRAAISLACLGDREYLLQMLDVTRNANQTNFFFSRALEWDADPSLWIELALSQKSANVTYYALCLIGSYPLADLPPKMPWQDIANLQQSPDAGVSSAAKWLLKKSPDANANAVRADSPGRRVLRCGLEQVKIDAGKSSRTVSPLGFELKNREVIVEQAFWLSSAPVSNADFNVFLKLAANELLGIKPIERSHERLDELEFDRGRAVTGLNPMLAAKYCNWLSVRQGLKPAYSILTSQDFSEDSGRVQLIEGADGFRLPTFEQIAYTAEFGLVEPKFASEMQMAVKAFHRNNGEELDQIELTRYAIARHVKSLMPNRAGIHFDFEAYECWAVAENQVCTIGLATLGKFLVHNREDREASPFAALWLVSDASGSAP